MKDKFQNIEVYHLTIEEGQLMAHIAFQEIEKTGEFPNNGNDTIKVPVKPLKHRKHA